MKLSIIRYSFFRTISVSIFIIISFFVGLSVISEGYTTMGDLDNTEFSKDPLLMDQVFNKISWRLDPAPETAISSYKHYIPNRICSGDVNDDGFMDIALIDADYHIFMVDGKTGMILWNSSVRVYHSGPFEMTYPTIADLDGSNGLEVIVGTDDGNLVILDGSTGNIQTYRYFGNIATQPKVIDLDGDEYLDIVVGLASVDPNPNVLCISGRTFGPIWSHTSSSFILFAPAIHDVDEDGVLDVIVVESGTRGTSGTFPTGMGIYCINGTSGNIIWSKTLPSFPQSFPSVADFDGDSIKEIIVPCDDIYEINPIDGVIDKTVRVEFSSYPLVCNIDSDAESEILLIEPGYREDEIIIIDSLIPSIYQPVPNHINRLFLQDIDGDGISEILIQCNNEMLYSYRAHESIATRFWNNIEMVLAIDIDEDFLSELLVRESEIFVLYHTNIPSINMQILGLDGGRVAYPDHSLGVIINITFEARPYHLENISISIGNQHYTLEMFSNGSDKPVGISNDIGGTVSMSSSVVNESETGYYFEFNISFSWVCPLRSWNEVLITVCSNNGLKTNIDFGKKFMINYQIMFIGNIKLDSIHSKLLDNQWIGGDTLFRLEGLKVVHDGPSSILVDNRVFGLTVLDDIDNITSFPIGTISSEIDIQFPFHHSPSDYYLHNISLSLQPTIPGCEIGSDIRFPVCVDVIPPKIISSSPRTNSWFNTSSFQSTIELVDPLGPGINESGIHWRFLEGDTTSQSEWQKAIQVVFGDTPIFIASGEFADGDNGLLQWRCFDRMGNSAPIVNISIGYDGISPAIEYAHGQYWWNETNIIFEFIVFEDQSGLNISSAHWSVSDAIVQVDAHFVRDNYSKYNVTCIIEVVGQGNQWISLEIYDNVNNGGSKLIRFGVDTNPPEISTDVPWILNSTDNDYRIPVTIDDTGGSGFNNTCIQYSIGTYQGEWTYLPPNKEALVQSLFLEIHLVLDTRIWLKCRDVAGNEGVVIGPIELNINNPPVPVITSPVFREDYRNPVLFKGTDSYDPEGLGLIYRWIVDGMEIDNKDSKVHVSLSEGTHSVVLVVDDGFNKNQTDPMIFYVSDTVTSIVQYQVIISIIVIVAIASVIIIYYRRN